MDDVVADWKGYARSILKKPEWKDGEILPQETWNRLKDDQRMYSKLPLKSGAIELVEWVTDFSKSNGWGLYFLSAIPKNNDMPWAPQDKVFWAKEYFPHIPVFLGPYSHEKHMHCNSGDILIDDRTVNCSEWENAGGIAHIYKNWEQCKIWLEGTLKWQN